MKKSFLTISVFIVAALIASCSSGVDSSRTVDLESGAGTIITDGGSIDPTQDVEVSFASAPGQVLAAMICYEGDEDVQGEIVDLTIIPIDALNVRVVPTNGSYPQKKRCELAISAFGEYYTYTLNTLCAPGDDFTNSATFDGTAAPTEYGTGCWKTFGNGSIDMLSGLVLIEDLADPTDNVLQALYKRMSGSNYTVELASPNLLYEFDTTLGRTEGVLYAVAISQDITEFNTGVSVVAAYVLYMVEYDDILGTVFKCNAVASNYTETRLEGCGDGSTSPNIGFIREGTVFTPYYSFDGGTTKVLFDLADGGTNYDLSSLITADEDLDVGILTIGDHLGVYGSVSAGEFVVSGDTAFVDE